MIRSRAQIHHTPDTRRDPTEPTPCTGLGKLFESRVEEDHERAKALCEGCWAFDACEKLLADVMADSHPQGRPEGTWAGVLYGGVLTKRGAGQLGNSKARGAA